MRRFAATLDSQAKMLTMVVLLITLIPILTIVSMYTRQHDPWLLLAPSVVVIGLGTAALYRINGYELDSEALYIKRHAGDVRYPLSQFRSITAVTGKELGIGLRTFGSGGFLGYFGKFYYRNHGHLTLYVTDREKMLLVTLADDRKFIISPQDLPGFMAAFQEYMKKRD